jgi:hypothetical protein
MHLSNHIDIYYITYMTRICEVYKYTYIYLNIYAYPMMSPIWRIRIHPAQIQRLGYAGYINTHIYT